MMRRKKLDHQDGYRPIVSSADLRVHQSLGRGLRPFDHAEWDLNRADIALMGKYANFAQNDTLLQHLLATRDRLIAESNP